ncbi:MAG TPA: hypothetical protein VFH53_09185 [Phycisphaerae bacterium]|nr:hypothetical protein [Phycisphaerae bacterium]HUX16346.1 hypothetical protein [Phycisphaerae bacterium]
MTLPLKTDAAGLFADLGEAILYRPLVGKPRSVTAIVNRQAIEPVAGVSQGMRQVTILEVLNDEQSGIGSREVDTGGDLVEIAPRTRKEKREYRIVDVEATDAGTVRLRVQ